MNMAASNLCATWQTSEEIVLAFMASMNPKAFYRFMEIKIH